MQIKSLLAILIALALVIPSTIAEQLAGPAAFEIPFRLTATKHILVRVKINGQGPFNLILDTGAPIVILARKCAETLKIPLDDSNWADVKRFEIEGGLALDNVAVRFDDLFQLEGMNGMGLAGVEIHGMLGYPILARYRIEYDLTKPKLIWTPIPANIQELPRRGGKNLATEGLVALGSSVKFLGTLFGFNKLPEAQPRGFVGLSLDNQSMKVTKVLDGGPAANSGVQIGDVLLKANGSETLDHNSFVAKLKPLTAGQTLKLTVQRGNVESEVTVILGGGF